MHPKPPSYTIKKGHGLYFKPMPVLLAMLYSVMLLMSLSIIKPISSSDEISGDATDTLKFNVLAPYILLHVSIDAHCKLLLFVFIKTTIY